MLLLLCMLPQFLPMLHLLPNTSFMSHTTQIHTIGKFAFKSRHFFCGLLLSILKNRKFPQQGKAFAFSLRKKVARSKIQFFFIDNFQLQLWRQRSTYRWQQAPRRNIGQRCCSRKLLTDRARWYHPQSHLHRRQNQRFQCRRWEKRRSPPCCPSCTRCPSCTCCSGCACCSSFSSCTTCCSRASPVTLPRSWLFALSNSNSRRKYDLFAAERNNSKTNNVFGIR